VSIVLSILLSIMLSNPRSAPILRIMYTCRPEQKDKSASLICICCFVCAVILYAGARFMGRMTAVTQLLSVVSATAGVFILIRYKLNSFLYILKSEGSEESLRCDFCVNQIRGKKELTLCRLDVKDLQKLIPLPDTGWRRDAALAEYGKALRVYNYCGNLFCKKYGAVFKDGSMSGENYICILFEPDKGFLAAFENAVSHLSDNPRTDDSNTMESSSR